MAKCCPAVGFGASFNGSLLVDEGPDNICLWAPCHPSCGITGRLVNAVELCVVGLTCSSRFHSLSVANICMDCN